MILLDSGINMRLTFEEQRANDRGGQIFPRSLVWMTRATQGPWDLLLSEFMLVLTVPKILMLQVKASSLWPLWAERAA